MFYECDGKYKNKVNYFFYIVLIKNIEKGIDSINYTRATNDTYWAILHLLSYTTDKWKCLRYGHFRIICELQKCAKKTNTQKVGNGNVFDKLIPMSVVCKTQIIKSLPPPKVHWNRICKNDTLWHIIFLFNRRHLCY